MHVIVQVNQFELSTGKIRRMQIVIIIAILMIFFTIAKSMCDKKNAEKCEWFCYFNDFFLY